MLWLPLSSDPTDPPPPGLVALLHQVQCELAASQLPYYAPDATLPGPPPRPETLLTRVHSGHVWLGVGGGTGGTARVRISRQYAAADMALGTCLQHLWHEHIGPCALDIAPWPLRSRLPAGAALTLHVPRLVGNARIKAAAHLVAETVAPFLLPSLDAICRPSVFRYLQVQG